MFFVFIILQILDSTQIEDDWFRELTTKKKNKEKKTNNEM